MRPPCKKDGHDCLNRRVGCQACCVDYLIYRYEQDRLNAELKPRRAALDYLCHSPKAIRSEQYRKVFNK